jgi:hypothetical protein
MYQFYFSCVFCELFKYNVVAFTLHLSGGVKGIIVKVIIVKYCSLGFTSCTLYIVPIGPQCNHPFNHLLFITVNLFAMAA